MTILDDVEDAVEEVSSELPDGLRENAYHKAFLVELTERGIKHTTESTISVHYKGVPVARVHPDIVIDAEDKVIVELKAGNVSGRQQCRRYIELAEEAGLDYDYGIYANFETDSVGKYDPDE